MTSLQVLDLSNNELSDFALNELFMMRELDISSNNRLHPIVIECISSFASLDKLSFEWDHPAKGLKCLSLLKQLSELNVYFLSARRVWKEWNDDLGCLTGLPLLRRLSLRNTKLTAGILLTVGNLVSLEQLTLSWIKETYSDAPAYELKCLQ